ncbi:RNA Hypothetical protein protein, fox-1 homolog (Hypothetical protein) [Nesidiocoris tenuis]|uniref:RRM domain-containing protein n=1 Tax=Nesidiocoris tenuis TaxID=355587 RepID=A0ABN7AUR1_9HEMI|nr:RNA Hypothetical protein protein, fox-1 homolog (Hypothetical protein) [Nesidiocoris tenuis]
MNFNEYGYFEKPSAAGASSEEGASCCTHDSAFNLRCISDSLRQALEQPISNKKTDFVDKKMPYKISQALRSSCWYEEPQSYSQAEQELEFECCEPFKLKQTHRSSARPSFVYDCPLSDTCAASETHDGKSTVHCEKPVFTYRSRFGYEASSLDCSNWVRIEPFVRQQPIPCRLPYTNLFSKNGPLDSNENVGACAWADEMSRSTCSDSPPLGCDVYQNKRLDCVSNKGLEEYPIWKHCASVRPPSPIRARNLGTKLIDDALKDVDAIRKKFDKLAQIYELSQNEISHDCCRDKSFKIEKPRNLKTPDYNIGKPVGKPLSKVSYYKIRAPGPGAMRQKNSSKLMSEPSPSRRLHVSNIPFTFNRQDLMNIFQNHGAVSADVIRNDRGPKGFGFVTFKTVEEATEARRIYDGIELNDRVLEINYASKFKRFRSAKNEDAK